MLVAGDYAVHALWTDTTTMNGDKPITGVSVHGSVVTPKHIATASAPPRPAPPHPTPGGGGRPPGGRRAALGTRAQACFCESTGGFAMVGGTPRRVHIVRAKRLT